jgi:hypothetical protein
LLSYACKTYIKTPFFDDLHKVQKDLPNILLEHIVSKNVVNDNFLKSDVRVIKVHFDCAQAIKVKY